MKLFDAIKNSLNSEINVDPGIFGQISVAVFIIVFGVFAFVGVYLWRLSKKSIVFDKFQGYFWKGNIDPRVMNSENENDFVRLTDIYALQIIAKRVRSTRGSVYRSYELNIVLKSGKRVRVVDHGNIYALRVDAKNVAGFLSVPVWDAAIR